MFCFKMFQSLFEICVCKFHSMNSVHFSNFYGVVVKRHTNCFHGTKMCCMFMQYIYYYYFVDFFFDFFFYLAASQMTDEDKYLYLNKQKSDKTIHGSHISKELFWRMHFSDICSI